MVTHNQVLPYNGHETSPAFSDGIAFVGADAFVPLPPCQRRTTHSIYKKQLSSIPSMYYDGLQPLNDTEGHYPHLNGTTIDRYVTAPNPEREEDRYVRFGTSSIATHEIPDPYGWMRLDTNSTNALRKRVLNHIERENRYTEQYYENANDRNGDRRVLQQELLQEYQSLVGMSLDEEKDNVGLQGDISQVYLRHGYYYYVKRLSNQPYPLHCRKGIDLLHHPDIEEVVLDENEIVKHLKRGSTQDYFAIHSVVPIHYSSNATHLLGAAFSVDLTGDESYCIFMLNLSSYEILSVANGTSGTMEIVENTSDDDSFSLSLHFVRLDPTVQRPYQWIECKLEATMVPKKSQTVHYSELIEQYWGHLSQTCDRRYLLWHSESSSSVGKILALDLKQSAPGPFELQIPFRNFDIDHRSGHWWIVDLDADAKSLRQSCQVFTASRSDASQLQPIEWPRTPASTIDDAEVALGRLTTFSNYLVLEGRKDGLQRIWALKVNEKREVEEWFEPLDSINEPANYVSISGRQDFYSDVCLLTYESMVAPPQIVQVNLTDRSLTVVHEQSINGHTKADFSCHRFTIPSRDGMTQIPVSLVHHVNASFPCPLHLLGYGAYGHSLEPSFSSVRLPLLNRGVACAVAHVRGGCELGPRWYHDGKGTSKQNSMDDFCDVAMWLIAQNWTKADALAAEGRSAGGLLVASAMNQIPSIFRAVVLGVPFLDILCTMADASLPLTVLEWDEWGNPHTTEGFQSIRGYAPMHNIAANQNYPSCLMVGGFHDPRVPYWEPLKFAAALRHETLQSDDRPILVKIDTSAGHSFGSNRTRYFEQLAYIYAFVLDQINGNLCGDTAT